MLTMKLSEALSKKLEAHMDGPCKMIEIILKYYKKSNNKLSNFCKGLEICTLNNTRVDEDYWFADFLI